MDIKAFIADSDKEQQGVWLDYDANKGVAFKIAYIGSSRYDDKLNRIAAAVRRRNRTRVLPASVVLGVTVDAIIDTILLDWKGLENNGQPFEYNAENAKLLLTQSKEIRDFVQVEAAVLENFQATNHESQSAETEGESAHEELKSGSGMAPKVGPRSGVS